MGFFKRYKLSTIFKHSPIAKITISQTSNLSNIAKLSRSTGNNNPTSLFSRPHKRVLYSSSNLGSCTHMRNYHNGHGTHHSNVVREYVVRKWGSWELHDKVYYIVIGCTVFTWLVVCNWETVPYTNRKHYIPSSDLCDPRYHRIWYGGCQEFKSHTLDQNDPTSRRVFNITKDLLWALEKDLKLGDGSMTLSYFSSSCERPTKDKFEGVKNKCWLQRRRERKVGKYHLNGMHWEVMVVNNPKVPTGALPNGKIIVTTDMLKLCETDHDIATLIGHEVGHVVARHSIEQLMIEPGILTILLFFRLGILIPFINWWYSDWRKAFIDYPISRSFEAEADRIGMMLMASAGYDPRMAPGFYIKLGGTQMSTHPTGKKRAEMLRKESIMQEAVALYNKVISEFKQDNRN